jgi:DNA-binding NtrC family response regulator
MKQIDVLVVEDSFYSADLNIRVLRKAGFNVRYKIASSSRTMREALKDKHWDLILSDNNMPGFDALQAIEIRNQSGSLAPFVIVSEHIQEIDIKKAMEKGCCAYIAKENLNRLGQQVEKILKE